MVGDKVAHKLECAPPSGAAILVFDDQSNFEYLENIDIPQLTFYKCRTFEEIDHYLSGVRAGQFQSPEVMGLDIYCNVHPDFGMFELDVELDPNVCGFQLYENVLRRVAGFESADALFFTSYRGDIVDLTTKRLARQYPNTHIDQCDRVEFREKLLKRCVARGLLDKADEIVLKTPGLTQEDYQKLFAAVSKEFGLSKAEERRFLGVSGAGSVNSLLKLSTIADERIDLLLAISIALDRIVTQADKRHFLQSLEPLRDGRRGFDLLLNGSVQDLLAIKREMEFRLGGAIL